MSKEEKECILRILDSLRYKQQSATQLVSKCTKEDLLKGYKGHSSATVYKALKRLRHFIVIEKVKRKKDGRGRPHSIYRLREEALGGTKKNETYSFGKNFANIVFDTKEAKELVFRSYRANLLFFAQELLVERIVSQLRDLPLDTKKIELFKNKLYKSIDMDCEELKTFAKRYVELILKSFGSHTEIQLHGYID